MGWNSQPPVNPPEGESDEDFDEYAGQPDTWKEAYGWA